jgi:hypothetical protein
MITLVLCSLALLVGCGKSGPITPATVTPEMAREMKEAQQKANQEEFQNLRGQKPRTNVIDDEERRHRQGR